MILTFSILYSTWPYLIGTGQHRQQGSHHSGHLHRQSRFSLFHAVRLFFLTWNITWAFIWSIEQCKLNFGVRSGSISNRVLLSLLLRRHSPPGYLQQFSWPDWEGLFDNLYLCVALFDDKFTWQWYILQGISNTFNFRCIISRLEFNLQKLN
jgi:hypothetical protein